MGEIYPLLALLSAVVLGLGLLTGVVNRIGLSAPLVAIVAGVLAGPVAGFLEPGVLGRQPLAVLEEIARYTLGIALMDAALRLPSGWLARNWRPAMLVLGLGMLLMWVASSLLAWLLLSPGLAAAVLIGAVLTPTNPVLAGAIISGDVARRTVPAPVRHLLSFESAANDGLGLAFVLLPILLLDHGQATGWRRWLMEVMAWNVLGGVAFGGLCGWLARIAHRLAARYWPIDEEAVLTVGLALSVFILSLGRVLGVDGVLAVFAGGMAFKESEAAGDFAGVQGRSRMFLEQPMLVLFGMALPVEAWSRLPMGTYLFVAAVLLLRRLPAFLLMAPLVAALRPARNALFMGWFGPIGISAVFYATMVAGRTGDLLPWHVASLVAVGSAVLHGLTALPGARAMGKGVDRHPSEGACEENPLPPAGEGGTGEAGG